MKQPLIFPFLRISRYLYSCIWAIALAFLLFTDNALAANINVNAACSGNDTHTLGGSGLTEGVTLPVDSEDIFAVGSLSEAVWQRTNIGSCTAIDSRQMDCNGILVTTPGTAISGNEFQAPAGLSGDPVDVEGTPMGEAEYTFEYQASDFDGTDSCSREYHVNINAVQEPFDIGFVLDRSGSMDDPSNDALNPTPDSVGSVGIRSGRVR
ncbi:MAG: hypothetical protein F6K00_18765 [Leptolyngbya sp. SIOISBB]|nr:hypothetical protein [Leptolyngbya sp. SIOISBB]